MEDDELAARIARIAQWNRQLRPGERDLLRYASVRLLERERPAQPVSGDFLEKLGLTPGGHG